MTQTLRPLPAILAAGALAALIGAAPVRAADPPTAEEVVDAFAAALGPARWWGGLA